MSVTISPPMYLQFLNSTGALAIGYKLFTYIAGTTTKQNTWTDSTQSVLNANPIILDATGGAVVWLDPTLKYKYVLALPIDTDPPGSPLRTVDNIEGPLTGSTFASFLTATVIGTALYPQTAAETSASLTPSSPQYEGLQIIDVLRYGIIPNSAGAAANNSSFLTALGNASVTGPKGTIIFPNTTGADTYYFSGIAHQFRPGLTLDLNGCTLNFSKTYNAPTDDAHGFIEAISNFECKNGKITVSYVGGGSNNAGPAFRFGSRRAPGGGYPFGSYPNGIFDADDNVFMGLIKLSKLSINTNCTSAPIIWMIGGIDGLIFENLSIDGGLGQPTGIACEYGFSSANGQPATISAWSSSHPRNMSFRNIRITNLLTSSPGAALDITGAYDCVVDGLSVDTANIALQYHAGEALYYRPWSRDATGVKPAHQVARNITAQNIAATAISLQGSEPAGSSYLSAVISALGHPADYAAQTDLMHFSLDGFAVSATVAGINVSGPCDIRNGTISGSCSSGGLGINDECMRFSINNVSILGGSQVGIRANFNSGTWSPIRRKSGTIENSLIAGNTGPGMAISNCKNVHVKYTRFGYNALYDVANESTQTYAIQVDATAQGGGVTADNCFVTVSGGAAGYNIVGSVTQLTDCCNIVHPKGTATSVGPWDYDNTGICTQGTVGPTAGSKSTYINNSGGLNAVAITFTGAPTGTSATLNANWTGLTGLWPIVFSDTETRYANFTNGAATCTWTPALTGTPTAGGNTVNTCGSNKYAGKMVYDTTNLRLLIATGPQCTDVWEICNATGGTVTPS